MLESSNVSFITSSCLSLAVKRPSIHIERKILIASGKAEDMYMIFKYTKSHILHVGRYYF